MRLYKLIITTSSGETFGGRGSRHRTALVGAAGVAIRQEQQSTSGDRVLAVAQQHSCIEWAHKSESQGDLGFTERFTISGDFGLPSLLSW